MISFPPTGGWSPGRAAAYLQCKLSYCPQISYPENAVFWRRNSAFGVYRQYRGQMDEQNNSQDRPQPGAMRTTMERRSHGRANDFPREFLPVLLGVADWTACRQSEFGRLLKDRAVVIRIIIVPELEICRRTVHQTLRSVGVGGLGRSLSPGCACNARLAGREPSATMVRLVGSLVTHEKEQAFHRA